MNCPHCGITIEIEQINCAIFRCGIYKHNGQQIPPHLSKEECDKLKKYDKIWGCGRPFKIANDILITCEYI